MVTFDAHAPGTPSAAWESSEGQHATPAADLSGVSELIVVAAHPDDETLGCGGLIAQLGARGGSVRVIAVTDGSASHPRSATVTARALRARRAEELREAVRRLDSRATVTWLGFPDGRTADFVEAIEDRLREELRSASASTIVAVTWRGDGHRDHRIVGGIVERVAPDAATVWGYPIWMWHWANPQTDGIPWDRAVRLSVTAAELARKQEAIAAFPSQLEPLSSAPGDERVLEPGMLAHFARDSETFFVAERAAVRS